MKEQLELNNVFLFDTISKQEMPAVIAAIDAAVVPLKKLDLFKGAIPSKIFENLAMRKPILLGVEGEAKELFIDQAKCGLAFIPEDGIDLAAKTLDLYKNPELLLAMGNNGYNYVKEHFTRDDIATKFWNYLIELPNT